MMRIRNSAQEIVLDQSSATKDDRITLEADNGVYQIIVGRDSDCHCCTGGGGCIIYNHCTILRGGHYHLLRCPCGCDTTQQHCQQY